MILFNSSNSCGRYEVVSYKNSRCWSNTFSSVTFSWGNFFENSFCRRCLCPIISCSMFVTAKNIRKLFSFMDVFHFMRCLIRLGELGWKYLCSAFGRWSSSCCLTHLIMFLSGSWLDDRCPLPRLPSTDAPYAVMSSAGTPGSGIFPYLLVIPIFMGICASFSI